MKIFSAFCLVNSYRIVATLSGKLHNMEVVMVFFVASFDIYRASHDTFSWKCLVHQ